MNVTLGTGKAVHINHRSTITGEAFNRPECGGNRASERYRVTAREVTCKKCLKLAIQEAAKEHAESVQEIADQVEGRDLKVQPNGNGHRIECTVCLWSKCHGTVQEALNHADTHLVVEAETAAETAGTRVRLLDRPSAPAGTVQEITECGDVAVLWDDLTQPLYYYPSELAIVAPEPDMEAVKEALNSPVVIDALHAEALAEYEADGDAIDRAIAQAEKTLLPEPIPA